MFFCSLKVMLRFIRIFEVDQNTSVGDQWCINYVRNFSLRCIKIISKIVFLFRKTREC